MSVRYAKQPRRKQSSHVRRSGELVAVAGHVDVVTAKDWTPFDYRTSLDYLAVPFATARANAEMSLIASVFPNHSAGIQIAEELGISGATFDQPDLRIVWSAFDTCREKHWGHLWGCARELLRGAGYWDSPEMARLASAMREQGLPFGDPTFGGMVWSGKNLLRLIDGDFHTSVVAFSAGRLIATARAMDRASEHVRFARRLLLSIDIQDDASSGWRVCG